jgi:hypothetical protein
LEDPGTIWTGSPAEYQAHCVARVHPDGLVECRCKTPTGPPRKSGSATTIAAHRDQTAPLALPLLDAARPRLGVARNNDFFLNSPQRVYSARVDAQDGSRHGGLRSGGKTECEGVREDAPLDGLWRSTTKASADCTSCQEAHRVIDRSDKHHRVSYWSGKDHQPGASDETAGADESAGKPDHRGQPNSA